MSLKSLRSLAAIAAVTFAAGAASAQTADPAAQASPAAPAAPAAAPVAPHGDLIETLRASGQFTTLLKGLDATNLTAVLKANQGLTLFAPTDAAFAALPPADLARLMSDPSALQKVLMHHVINAKVTSSQIKGSKGPWPSVAGDGIELDGSGEMLMADNAGILQPDVAASNGVLHVVDHVLSPGAVRAAAAAPAAAAPQTSEPPKR